MKDFSKNLVIYRNDTLLYERLSFLQTNLSRAKGRKDGKEIEISKWYLEEIYQKQKGKCALSGVDLEFKRGGTYWGGKWCNPNSCTIDRINSNLGYVRGNVQLVTWEVNATKSHLQNQDFIRLCEHVVSHQKVLME
jgi:hypothetical protein